MGSLLKSIYSKSFEYQEILANIYKQEVVDIKTYNLIIINILGNKINESLEHKNNFLINQNIRLNKTKYPENKANILIYLLSFILSLTIQKEQSLLLLDLPEQDTTL
jgi:hypothetical protein